jgi:hypothetical protein
MDLLEQCKVILRGIRSYKRDNGDIYSCYISPYQIAEALARQGISAEPVIIARILSQAVDNEEPGLEMVFFAKDYLSELATEHFPQTSTQQFSLFRMREENL